MIFKLWLFIWFVCIGIAMQNEQQTITHVLHTPLFPIEYVVTPYNIFLSEKTIARIVHDNDNAYFTRLVRTSLETDNKWQSNENLFEIDSVYHLIDEQMQSEVQRVDKQLKNYACILKAYLDRIKGIYVFPDDVEDGKVDWKNKAYAVAKYIKDVFGGNSVVSKICFC
jgi:hypothetical protein